MLRAVMLSVNMLIVIMLSVIMLSVIILNVIMLCVIMQSVVSFGISCMTTDNFCFYFQNRLIQTSKTGGQRYSDTSPFSFPWKTFEECILGTSAGKQLSQAATDV